VAELQLAIPYRARFSSLALASVIVLLPLWSLVTPAVLGIFVGWVMTNLSSCPPFATALVISVLLGTMIFGFLLSGLVEENKLHISKNGIAFPPFLMPFLQFRRHKFWNELRRADLVASEENPILILGFDSGASLPLRLRGFKNQDIEELLLAIELWGSDCERSPVLIEYQSELQNQTRGISGPSYTQMWDEELSHRFNHTTFVPLEPGTMLQKKQEGRGHRFKIVKQLAFGGFSAIYLAQQDGTDLVVLKEAVVPPDADPGARTAAERHLQRESQMLAQLRHPQISRVLDVFAEDNRHYLVLQYVSGQDLRQMTRQNGPQPEQKVLEWGMQLASVLEYLHEQNPPVIHRDFTPDNIVMRNDGALIVIDFGASNEFIGTATGTMVGKQCYMAPEQLRGKTALQSDLYALGCTLYFLLTGRDPIPLSEANASQIMPSTSEALTNLIINLTRYNREERIQSAAEVAAALKTIASAHEANSCDKVVIGDRT
jgi:hypothetical protein